MCSNSRNERSRPSSGILQLRLAAALVAIAAAGAAAEPVRDLRVCADPNNLPFSNERLEGFENKIAEVIAKDLNASVRYTWISQRGGFIRKTLKAGNCDVIMGVPSGYDLVLATKPYYSSSYVFVYAKNKNLELRSFDDPVLRKVRIGIQGFGGDGASPAAIALGNRGIMDKIVGFTILDSAENPSGKIIDAVSAGEIDVAIVWVPFAGFFARKQPVELEVVPVSSSLARPDRSSLRFRYIDGGAARRRRVQEGVGRRFGAKAK